MKHSQKELLDRVKQQVQECKRKSIESYVSPRQVAQSSDTMESISSPCNMKEDAIAFHDEEDGKEISTMMTNTTSKGQKVLKGKDYFSPSARQRNKRMTQQTLFNTMIPPSTHSKTINQF